MKAYRVQLFLFAVLLSLPAFGHAQVNGPSPRKQEKIAHKYQKHLQKQQHKQEKLQAKQLKAFRKQHQ